MKIELPNEYNTKALKRKINKAYPDLEYAIRPARMIVEGSGDGELIPAQIRIKGNVNKELKAELEMFVTQTLFDLSGEKTDAEQNQDDKLKELLSGPAFVYILNELDDLKKEIKKLKKETTQQEPEINETIEIQPSESIENLPVSEEPRTKRKGN